MENKMQRKTYPINAQKSVKLARYSISLGQALGRTVTKQSILEALIDCMADKDIYSKVVKKLSDDR